jgi:hypothetical protein
MDNLNRYRHIIRELIQRYAQHQPACGEVQIEVIFDETNDHYELMYAGWNGPYHIHGSVLHIDIRQEKVWIQYDGTEDGIVEEYVKAGIPRDHIVLAFKPPDIRAHTDFAVACTGQTHPSSMFVLRQLEEADEVLCSIERMELAGRACVMLSQA